MILVQCVNSKRDTEAPAKDLYDSTYFDVMRRYAEATQDNWRILSAKHGLIHPETVIEPYDEFGISDEQAASIATTLATAGINHVEIIAGKKYTNPLTPELEEHGIDVREVCRGMEIGNRISRLQTLSRKKENHTL